MNSARDYRKLNSQESLNDKKLKIPPAFVADQWVCNHKSAKKKEYLDSLNLRDIKFNKIEKLCKNSVKPYKSNDCVKKMDSAKQTKNELISKIPEIKEKNLLSKVISKNISKIKIDLKSKHKQKALFTKLDKNDHKNLNNNSKNETANTQMMLDISINDYESQSQHECDNLNEQDMKESNSNDYITPTNSVNNSNCSDDLSNKSKQSFEEKVSQDIREKLSDKIKLESKSESNKTVVDVNDNQNDDNTEKIDSIECLDVDTINANTNSDIDPNLEIEMNGK